MRLAAIRALSRYSGEEIHAFALGVHRRFVLRGTWRGGTCAPRERRGLVGMRWDRTSKSLLRTHVTIGDLAWDWGVMIADRNGARLALEHALHDDYESVRRLATDALRLLDYYRDRTTPPAEGTDGRQ